MILAAATALEQRARTGSLAGLAAVAHRVPALGLLLAVALALSLGVPGLAGFWGPMLVLAGGFARHPVLTVLLAAGFVASAAAHVRVASAVLFGRAAPPEPSGSSDPRPSDAAPRELAVLVSLAAMALLLGVWPGPLLSQIADGVRDASAAVDPSGTDPTMEPR
jgi:NADH-quinone oxidoreductase subunit M